MIAAKPSLKTAFVPLQSVAGNPIAQATAVVLLAQEVVLMPMVLVAVSGMICKLPVCVLDCSCAPVVKIKLSACSAKVYPSTSMLAFAPIVIEPVVAEFTTKLVLPDKVSAASQV